MTVHPPAAVPDAAAAKLEEQQAIPLQPQTLAAFMKAIDELRAAGAVVVFDDSMLPEFRSGDCVVIDPTSNAQPGDFVLAISGGETILRQHRATDTGFTLHPLNPVYATLRSDRATIRTYDKTFSFR